MDEPNCFIELYKLKGGGLTLKKTKSEPIKIEISATRSSLIRYLKKIGFTKSIIINHFLELDESYFWDYNPMMFIVEYSVKNTRKTIMNEKKIESIDYYLFKIGLKRTVIQKLLPLLEPLLELPVSMSQIVEMALFYLLGLYKSESKSDSKFLLLDNEVNKWITVKNTKIYNYTNICSLDNISEIQNIIQENVVQHTNNNYQIYYHTTNWRSYPHIIRKINCNYGRNCLDFGRLPSFYLNSELKNAIQWGSKTKGLNEEETCIIIFRIPNSFLEYSKDTPVKIFNKADKEWKQLTKKSRLCIENELDDYYLIKGPMVANPMEIEKGIMPVPHKPEKIQIAVKDSRLCNQLNNYIIGTVFFNKNI